MNKFYGYLDDFEMYDDILIECIKEAYELLFESNDMESTLDKIKHALKPATGLYLVGGAVRDEILGNSNKDIDILVTGMEISDIVEALKPISSHVGMEGESFSAVKAKIDNEDFDFVIPRTEQSTGTGHKDFKVVGDPFLSPEKDAGRRDFTMNAIMKNLRTGEIFDPTGGLNDIKDKRIRAVGNAQERFSEDPLRMLRALQFASRMNFNISDETLASIKENGYLLNTIAKERIFEEFNKAFSKSSPTEKLIELLDVTGIGYILFGEQFSPRNVEFTGLSPDMKKIYGFIALFIDGGNPSKMSPTGEYTYFLQLAKNLESNKHPVDYIRSSKDVESVASLKQFFSHDILNKINKILKMPMTSSQLAVTAEELMGIGIPQVKLGMVIKSIMKAVYDGNIKNDHDSIISFVKNNM